MAYGEWRIREEPKKGVRMTHQGKRRAMSRQLVIVALAIIFGDCAGAHTQRSTTAAAHYLARWLLPEYNPKHQHPGNREYSLV